MLKRIGIHLSNDDAGKRRIEIGLQLAKKHEAEVVGIYPVYGSGGLQHEHGVIRQDVHNQLREAAKVIGVKAEWRVPQGNPEDVLALHARYCDVLIMSKAERSVSASSLIANLPEAVVMAAGRPVLMLPNYGTISPIGRRILFCWDQRREAARAFADAAPFLRACEELVILEIDRDHKRLGESDIHPDDISRYCTSLGYPTPKRLEKTSAEHGVGNVILNAATDTGSDLIVMGAYGHSRMREWVMGGASRTLLSTMTVPVLLAH
ncbi:universal stress protein [Pusillimonas sp. CC-YST705]|uniref:Universal stress protein n=1 Tax=Mesopusillimonas faecipullorum TaxID=2755040 RepID=A0ABS8C9R5_9BURK|nr:universal stress protein [Mesopusillimonas faecipullorum]MCB5362776.1 universal stress protein [Mesopusillimonas faecipullorum]